MSEGKNDDGGAPSEAELDELFQSLSNWGRWGEDDERGMLNLLLPEHRAAAATSVQEGKVVSLAHDLGTTPSPENPYPAQHHMLAAGDARSDAGIPGYEASRDYVGAHVHGLGVTHIDALCHMFVKGKMYNGFPASDVRSSGALRNSTLSFAEGIVGRGVFLDLAWHRGVSSLRAGEVIRLEELMACESKAGVEVGPGDILIVGAGRTALREENGGPLNPADGMTGLHAECLPWLQEKGIALLGSDGISDPMPGLGIPNWPFPIHQVGIAGMGLHLIDNMALGELSARCQSLGRWHFLFTMGSIRVPGGTGCPVNPIALL
ncbi:MAG: cyclase family protein [Myxococcota bacterium]